MQKEYHLSKDAFAFIAMGFTGTKANRWKLLFINAFNTTIEQLFEQHEEHTRMWTESRSKLSASTVAMSDALKEQLDLTGKDSSAWKVYSNEHRLIGKCMTGEFTGLLRERMTTEQILILAKLEMKNMVLIAQGKDYRERKPILMSYAEPLIAKLPDVEKPQAVLLSANKKLVLKLEKIETTGGSS